MDTDGIAATPATHVGPGYTLQENLSNDDWIRKYWFNSYQKVTVRNPKHEDYVFMQEMRHYKVPADGIERFIGPVANRFLDLMSRIIAQDEGNLGFMADPNLKRIYYDKLIVKVDNEDNSINVGPAYMANMGRPAQAQPMERAPWDAALGERATDIMPNATPIPPQMPEMPVAQSPTAPAEAPKAETRQFELEGATYKMVVNAKGQKMHYRDSKMISAADYNKAASML